MDFQVIAAILFVLFISIFLFFKRKNIVVQKILFPFLYIIMYRSNFGIRFMNKISKKYRNLIQFIGYCGIGFSIVGMIFITINILYMAYMWITKPAISNGVALVLPFTNVPGIGYLPFFQWLLCIIILAIIHEFAHGIVAKSHGLKIKSSGFAFFSLLAPIIPAAFVEPDEKKLRKTKDTVQYSVFAAGPMANITLALIILLLMPYVANPAKLAPFEEQITVPKGFAFDFTNSTLPAASSGMPNNTIITRFNGEELKDASEFLTEMYHCVDPGQKISLGNESSTYMLTTVDDGTGRGIIGVNNLRNERDIKPEYSYLKSSYYWLKSFFKWLFLLNFFIGLFNLLPLGIVDGGRILNTFLENNVKDKKKARKIWSFISFFLLAILVIGLIISYFGNPFV